MLRLSFFRTTKPRQYDYIPRYYDPKKEKREERRKELLGPDREELTDGKYVPGTYLRDRIKYRRGIGQPVSKRKKSTLTPLKSVFILAVLAVLVLWATGVI